MGFKKAEEYESDRRGYRMVLPNDNDFADVIFLYHDFSEVLIADAHYIKGTGYVHCCGSGCPACAKGEQSYAKLFIPVLVLGSSDDIALGQVKFWERSQKYAETLKRKVFENYPDPSGYVFRITRHGQARDINTTYDIRPINKAPEGFEMDTFLEGHGISFPDYYENMIKDLSVSELYDRMSVANHQSSSEPVVTNTYSYNVKPRKTMVDPSTLSMDDLPNDDEEEEKVEVDAPFDVDNASTDPSDDDDEPNF